MIKYFEKSDILHRLNKQAQALSWTIEVPQQITAQTIENIVVDAFEASDMHYWALLDNSTAEWQEKPKEMPVSQYAVELLLDGKSIKFCDVEGTDDDSAWILTLEKLLQGIKLNAINRPYDCDLENTDASTVNCIMQYAILGEVVYE